MGNGRFSCRKFASKDAHSFSSNLMHGVKFLKRLIKNHSFLEDLEVLSYPFLGDIGSLPNWFFRAYFFIAYLGIVRKKECPDFFRFHVVMGMLLEVALQVVGTVSRWMPFIVYWGKFSMHFWTVVAFGYLPVHGAGVY